jgi:hypothetical protein
MDAHIVQIGADPHEPGGVRALEDIAELKQALRSIRERERRIGPPAAFTETCHSAQRPS